MRSRVAFDVCHGVFAELRELAYLRLATSEAESVGDGLWRPHTRPRLLEYAIDFALAGERALRGKKRSKFLILFRVYYLGGAEYLAARRHLGIGEMTWAERVDQIRALVGAELLKRKIFPPGNYFNGELDCRSGETAWSIPRKGPKSWRIDRGVRTQERECPGQNGQAGAARGNLDANAA